MGWKLVWYKISIKSIKLFRKQASIKHENRLVKSKSARKVIYKSQSFQVKTFCCKSLTNFDQNFDFFWHIEKLLNFWLYWKILTSKLVNIYYFYAIALDVFSPNFAHSFLIILFNYHMNFFKTNYRLNSINKHFYLKNTFDLFWLWSP